MGIDLTNGYRELREHLGHTIALVSYGHPEEEDPDNVAIECEDCSCVLIDFDHPEVEGPEIFVKNWKQRVRSAELADAQDREDAERAQRIRDRIAEADDGDLLDPQRLLAIAAGRTEL